MVNKYIIRFFNVDEQPITLPVKAESAEIVSDKIIALYKQRWLSFPVTDKYTRTFGSERMTVNLEKVKYFKVEKPTKVMLETYSENDFILFE
ncbi:hypothetical protein ACQYAD_11140 [Neobacillus sp. SM06]|uniref:hypothetical protein n=1 Tax=Neobacillus sp. SM06 TaxID=3422492 RepID=UPI003D2B4419